MIPEPIIFVLGFNEKQEQDYHTAYQRTDSILKQLGESPRVIQFSLGNDALSPHLKDLYFYGGEGMIMRSSAYRHSPSTRKFRWGCIEIACHSSQENNSLAASLEKAAQEAGFRKLPAE